jgi:3-deoxy-manno-octulosonate cytidylyltransferase (CMP-KDO synthetase)
MKTQRRLAEILKVMMSETPLDEISVSSLAAKAGINRKTFYYHFHDVYDLLTLVFLSEKVEKINKIVVATDDKRIVECCKKYDIPTILTSSEHRTAANRLQEVSQKIEADFYLQINGDEPLIQYELLSIAIPNEVPQDVEFGTNIITKMTSPVEVMDNSNIKVVFDDKLKALYMSRTPIPYPFKSLNYEYYKHVGIIGYNKKMLDFYANSKPGKFELIEGIDTLRFLDYGKTLQFIIADNVKTLSVDTEKDLEKVINIIKENL